jgi:hypothetical protein
MADGASWRLLGWTGWLFVVVGGVDSLLTWLPLSLGQPEWEFGTVTASLNGLPLPVLGLVLVLGASLVAGRVVMARVVAVLMVILALCVLAAGLLYALNVPLALRAVTDPVARQGVLKAMTKTIVQVVAYPTGLITLAVIAWSMTKRAP